MEKDKTIKNPKTYVKKIKIKLNKKEALKKFNSYFPEFAKKFANNKACEDFIFNERLSNGFLCPKCKKILERPWHIKTRNLITCKNCNFQLSPTARTIFHGGHLPIIDKFRAFFLVVSGRTHIRIQELLGCNRKTAMELEKDFHDIIIKSYKIRGDLRVTFLCYGDISLIFADTYGYMSQMVDYNSSEIKKTLYIVPLSYLKKHNLKISFTYNPYIVGPYEKIYKKYIAALKRFIVEPNHAGIILEKAKATKKIVDSIDRDYKKAMDFFLFYNTTQPSQVDFYMFEQNHFLRLCKNSDMQTNFEVEVNHITTDWRENIKNILTDFCFYKFKLHDRYKECLSYKEDKKKKKLKKINDYIKKNLKERHISELAYLHNIHVIKNTDYAFDILREVLKIVK